MEAQTAHCSRARRLGEDTWDSVHRSPPHLAAALPTHLDDHEGATREEDDGEEWNSKDDEMISVMRHTRQIQRREKREEFKYPVLELPLLRSVLYVTSFC